MANSFGHNGHHQATSQKLKKIGTYSAQPSICTGSHLHLYILAALNLTALKCAVYIMMCRGSVMDAASTFKIVTF